MCYCVINQTVAGCGENQGEFWVMKIICSKYSLYFIHFEGKRNNLLLSHQTILQPVKYLVYKLNLSSYITRSKNFRILKDCFKALKIHKIANRYFYLAGDISQRLRTLIAFENGLGSAASGHTVAHN